jgi:hypothetical protein
VQPLALSVVFLAAGTATSRVHHVGIAADHRIERAKFDLASARHSAFMDLSQPQEHLK